MTTQKTRRVTVNVTQECIDKGVRDHCSFCPVALAFRAIGLIVEVYKVSAIVRFNVSGQKLAGVNQIYLPESVHQFIYNFDEGIPVMPFAFDADIPEEAFANS